MTNSIQREIETEVAVIGAGAAGCAAALALGGAGLSVTLVEKGAARRDRFCGEFISGEALAALSELGARESVEALGPAPIARVRLASRAGRRFELPLGARGWGLSRRALDGALIDEALAQGVQLIEHAGVEEFSGDTRRGYLLRLGGGASGTEIRCRAVIGAHGKASQVDRLLGRPFVHKPSRYIGVKCRFEGADRGDRVELYLFPGGYCGVAAIEGGRANVCLLARREVLAACGGRPMGVIEAAARENKAFGAWFPDARPIEGTLMSVARIPFREKRRVVRGVFMAGDSAGVLPPFLGIAWRRHWLRVCAAARPWPGGCGATSTPMRPRPDTMPGGDLVSARPPVGEDGRRRCFVVRRPARARSAHCTGFRRRGGCFTRRPVRLPARLGVRGREHHLQNARGALIRPRLP